MAIENIDILEQLDWAAMPIEERATSHVTDSGVPLTMRASFPTMAQLAGQSYVAKRLSAFSDGDHWSITLEDLRVSDGRLEDSIYYFGSAIDVEVGDIVLYEPIDDDSWCEAFDEDDRLVGDATVLSVCGEQLSLSDVRSALLEQDTSSSTQPESADVLRIVSDIQPNVLFAPESVLRSHLTRDLPLVLQLNQWRHPGIGSPPSRSESFRMIADVIVMQDANLYLPTDAPNTHWSLSERY